MACSCLPDLHGRLTWKLHFERRCKFRERIIQSLNFEILNVQSRITNARLIEISLILFMYLALRKVRWTLETLQWKVNAPLPESRTAVSAKARHTGQHIVQAPWHRLIRAAK